MAANVAPVPPTIDLSGDRDHVVAEVKRACREWGGFVAVGHGINPSLLVETLRRGHAFFDLPLAVKEKYNLTRNGTRWRGYMPQGGERSENGVLVDFKEGLYLGEEHDATNPRVQARLPTFGTNVLPDVELPEMRDMVSRWLGAMKGLGDRMMDVLSLALGLRETYLREHVTERKPVVLPRLFRYPPQQKRGDDGDGGGDTDGAEVRWGIGKHSDYGLWTMILTDAPGLEFLHPQHGWCAVPLVDGGIVMNVGDVLDRLSDGRFRSPYHRARNLSRDVPRLSAPFFYDPSWNARMATLPLPEGDGWNPSAEERKAIRTRWERTKIRCKFDGRVAYSEFLAKKVAKVFPDVVPPSLWRNFASTSAPSTRHALTVPVPEKRPTSALQEAIEEQRQRVLKHPLYAELRGGGGGGGDVAGAAAPVPLAVIRRFMEHHVWCVWDYFQPLKRLQRELTCTTVPWVPRGDPQLRRFINEIVLEEETDLFEDKTTYGSHLELYLRGMAQAGADCIPMERFLKGLSQKAEVAAAEGVPTLLTADHIADSAEAEGAPPAAVAHIRATLRLAMEGSKAEVAAVFAFGREDVIPLMFVELLPGAGLGGGANGEDRTSIFRYYLERHIELDGEDHGPLAIRLVETVCHEGGAAAWGAATAAVNGALAHRCALWDAVRARGDGTGTVPAFAPGVAVQQKQSSKTPLHSPPRVKRTATPHASPDSVAILFSGDDDEC